MKSPIAEVILWIIAIFFLLAIGLLADSGMCSDASVEMNTPTKFSMISGCYFYHEGNWYPLRR